MGMHRNKEIIHKVRLKMRYYKKGVKTGVCLYISDPNMV